MLDGGLDAGVWNPGLHGVARNDGRGGGTKAVLGVDASWQAAAADDDGDDNDDVGGDTAATLILPTCCICCCCCQ